MLEISNEWIGSNQLAAQQLCYASFAMDLYALKYLLYDVGELLLNSL